MLPAPGKGATQGGIAGNPVQLPIPVLPLRTQDFRPGRDLADPEVRVGQEPHGLLQALLGLLGHEFRGLRVFLEPAPLVIGQRRMPAGLEPEAGVLDGGLKLGFPEVGPVQDLLAEPGIVPGQDFLHEFRGQGGVPGRGLPDARVFVLQGQPEVVGGDILGLQGQLDV